MKFQNISNVNFIFKSIKMLPQLQIYPIIERACLIFQDKPRQQTTTDIHVIKANFLLQQKPQTIKCSSFKLNDLLLFYVSVML